MKKFLIVIAGLPGTGKTTTARKLAEELGYVLIEQNEIRRKYGMKRMPKTQEKVLLEIDQLIMNSLLTKKGVIFESGNRLFGRRHQLYGIASACNVKVTVLECICSEKESKKRMRSRPPRDDLLSDPRDEKVYDKIKNLWQPIEKDFEFPYQGHVSYITFNTETQKIGRNLTVQGTVNFIDKIERMLTENNDNRKTLFSSIKAIGFDIDQTLYPKSEEINKALREEIAEKILQKKPELENPQKALEIYEKRYQEVGSWTKIFGELGFENPKKIMEECLLTEKALDLIEKDEKIVNILKKIKDAYSLFLITSNPQKLGLLKLEKIGINSKIFDYLVFGDEPGFDSKIDGSPFKIFLEKSKFPPEQCLYVGDNLKSDILPLKPLGMRTVLVGDFSPEADFSIKQIHDIEKLLCQKC